MVDRAVGPVYLRPFVSNPLVIDDMNLERTIASTILKRYESFFPEWLVLHPQSEFIDPLSNVSKTERVDSPYRGEDVVVRSVLRKIYAYDENCNGRNGGEK
jgi:hypothetical protein